MAREYRFRVVEAQDPTSHQRTRPSFAFPRKCSSDHGEIDCGEEGPLQPATAVFLLFRADVLDVDELEG